MIHSSYGGKVTAHSWLSSRQIEKSALKAVKGWGSGVAGQAQRRSPASQMKNTFSPGSLNSLKRRSASVHRRKTPGKTRGKSKPSRPEASMQDVSRRLHRSQLGSSKVSRKRSGSKLATGEKRLYFIICALFCNALESSPFFTFRRQM